MTVRLTSRLGDIARDLPTSADRAVNDTGEAIAAAARARARVDSGDMRDGITWVPTGAAGGAVEGRDWKTHFHEFGTTRRPAQPMLVPAADAERERFHQRLQRNIR